jgi:hypothetical protein
MDYKDQLLKACYELLKKQEESDIVLDLTCEVVEYDGVECDGSFIMNEIAEMLELEE